MHILPTVITPPPHTHTHTQEFADALMDVKKSIADIMSSPTLKLALGSLLSIGNFLNGREVEAFDLEYLNRVADVKDTAKKVSLMTHLVELVIDQFPNSTDLYSELPHVHRVAKVRYL